MLAFPFAVAFLATLQLPFMENVLSLHVSLTHGAVFGVCHFLLRIWRRTAFQLKRNQSLLMKIQSPAGSVAVSLLTLNSISESFQPGSETPKKLLVVCGFCWFVSL